MAEGTEDELERRPPTILNPAEPPPVRRDPPFPPGPVHDSSTVFARLFSSPYSLTVLGLVVAVVVIWVAVVLRS